jgi:hypothetical protein
VCEEFYDTLMASNHETVPPPRLPEIDPMKRTPNGERWMIEKTGKIHVHEEAPDGGYVCLLQFTPDEAKTMAKRLWAYQKAVREYNQEQEG